MGSPQCVHVCSSLCIKMINIINLQVMRKTVFFLRLFYSSDWLIIQLIQWLVSMASHVPADGLAAPPPVKGGYEII